MYRLVKLTLIFTFVLSGIANAQNFDALTSKIFFDADVKRLDSTIISDFNSKSALTFKKVTGWISFPPTYKQGDPFPYCTFNFSKHPYFSSGIDSGAIEIMTNRESNKVTGLSLSISFKSVKSFNSTYSRIKKLYSKYASKTIKRPNMAEPYEVTKYYSDNGIDYVIITKGENEKKPFIDFAYLHQSYEW